MHGEDFHDLRVYWYCWPFELLCFDLLNLELRVSDFRDFVPNGRLLRAFRFDILCGTFGSV